MESRKNRHDPFFRRASCFIGQDMRTFPAGWTTRVSRYAIAAASRSILARWVEGWTRLRERVEAGLQLGRTEVAPGTECLAGDLSMRVDLYQGDVRLIREVMA